MYNKTEYESFVRNNTSLTNCQKREFLNTKQNIFYLNAESNKQIITYIDNAQSDLYGSVRIYILFNHFLKLDFVNKLLDDIKLHRYSDSEIYSKVMEHPKEFQKGITSNRQVFCSQYTYTFEKLALVLYHKYLNPSSKPNLTYLDVGCGNGSKTKLFADKLNLSKKNIWGTDIEEWGPYKSQSKSSLPIQFKLLKDNKLDFKDNEFDLLSIFLALHHIPPDQINSLLEEFKRVLKPNGILVIIEHNILDDFDHLIVDIEHGFNSHIYDKKPDDTYAHYFNYMELDFILTKHNFHWTYGYQMTSNVGFGVRYDNPFYGLYINKK